MIPARKSLAVIGGGASAVLLLTHLMHPGAAMAPCDITIFDRTGIFAKGIAYGTQRREHLLNVRAANMSALQSDPGHFVRWLESEGHSYGPADFVPRMIYGAYLSSLFEQSIQAAQAKGHRVSLDSRPITGIERENEGKPYQLASGAEMIEADIVVLASGNARPLTPRRQGDTGNTYHDHPWAIDFENMDKTADIVILGTGLSMIDTAMSLHKAGFKGKITAISRRGLMPGPHVDPATYPAFIDDKSLPQSPVAALKLIKAHVKKAAAQDIPWQAVIDSLRPFTNTIWQGWSVRERARFNRLLPYWNIHRHRMAPQIAATIAQMQEAGTLHIVKDSVQSVSAADKGIAVTGARGQYRADLAINCLGYSPASDLFAPGDEQGAAGFHALGPPLLGHYLETTAIPEIRAQAAQLAELLARG